jgi:hypothetical protein
MQTRQMERCFARVENPLNSGPLIYSQWAGGRKAFSSEGLKKILFDKNLLWNLLGRPGGGMIRRPDQFFDHTRSVTVKSRRPSAQGSIWLP